MLGTLPLGDLEPIERLSRDIKKATTTLCPDEARYLVSQYYSIQDSRIATKSRERALDKRETPEPHEVITWIAANMSTLEKDIQKALDTYSDSVPVGLWMKEICGIGPVIASGLLAHLDITQAPTVGHIWSYAGLNPMAVWSKGQKRPWNADLKVICWKAGHSFMMVSGNPNDIYGKLYLERKEYEIARNTPEQMGASAAAYLAAKNYRKETKAYEAYSSGILPPAQIDARARRWAVKLFLSHLHEAMYFDHYGKLPPKPYVMDQLHHAHEIKPPHTDMIDGWAEARANASKSNHN